MAAMTSFHAEMPQQDTSAGAYAAAFRRLLMNGRSVVVVAVWNGKE